MRRFATFSIITYGISFLLVLTLQTSGADDD